MWHGNVHSQSYATFFRHSAVLSDPALLLRKLPIIGTRKGKQLHRPIKLIAKSFRALLYFSSEYGKTFNCVINKRLEHDWLLTALIYGLIGCFSSKLSDYEHLQSDKPNRTVKQQIKIKHFTPLTYKL